LGRLDGAACGTRRRRLSTRMKRLILDTGALPGRFKQVIERPTQVVIVA
jgi:hypothetical protein